METTLTRNDDGDVIAPLPEGVLDELDLDKGDVVDLQVIDGEIYVSRPGVSIPKIVSQVRSRKDRIIDSAAGEERAYQTGFAQALKEVNETILQDIQTVDQLDEALDIINDELNTLRIETPEAAEEGQVEYDGRMVLLNTAAKQEEFKRGLISGYNYLVERFNDYQNDWLNTLEDQADGPDGEDPS